MSAARAYRLVSTSSPCNSCNTIEIMFSGRISRLLSAIASKIPPPHVSVRLLPLNTKQSPAKDTSFSPVHLPPNIHQTHNVRSRCTYDRCSGCTRCAVRPVVRAHRHSPNIRQWLATHPTDGFPPCSHLCNRFHPFIHQPPTTPYHPPAIHSIPSTHRKR